MIEGEKRLNLAAGGIAALTAVAYANSFGVPFLLDDTSAIIDNPTVGAPGSWWRALAPPDWTTTGGRPVINLSFALNYAWSGQRVWSYHLVNLAVHILAALTLFGIARRTLLTPSLRDRFGGRALPLGALIAALWALHPVQTEAVTYLTERVESLMGLFYLLTLYCFIRGAEFGAQNSSRVQGMWFGLSWLACLLGMATKETMVTAPVIVLLYDRAFMGGSFLEALRRRAGYYLALGSTWLLLGGLMWSSNVSGRRGVGFHAGVSGWAYALGELKVVVEYAKLCVWPHPLIFDYGAEPPVHGLREAAPYAFLLAAAVAAAGFAWRKSEKSGFLAVSFFVLLSPTSSFVPLPLDPMAESRLYLPLAAVVALAVMAGYRWGGSRAIAGLAVVAVAFGALTYRRNETYRTALSIWGDTVAKVPGRLPDAVACYRTAVRLDPGNGEAFSNLGRAMLDTGRPLDALADCEQAVRLKPELPAARNNLGLALERLGRIGEAITEYRTALFLKPDYGDARRNLSDLLQKSEGTEEGNP